MIHKDENYSVKLQKYFFCNGTGKSHLAIALGVKAAEAGISVYFTNSGNLKRGKLQAEREKEKGNKNGNYTSLI
ncbi:MAG: ATP-binding protein [Methanobacterium sp.]